MHARIVAVVKSSIIRKCFYVFTTNAQSVRVPRGDLFFIRVSIIFLFFVFKSDTTVEKGRHEKTGRRRNERVEELLRFRGPIQLPQKNYHTRSQ